MGFEHARWTLTTKSLPKAVRRLGWSVLDQVAYGAGNVLLVSQFSRNAVDLAALSAAYVVVTTVVLMVRGGLSEVLISSSNTYDDTEATNAKVKVLLICVTCPLAVVGVVAVLVHYSPVTILVAGLPILLLQDRMRFEWLQSGQPAGAFRLDMAWVFAQVTFLILSGSLLSPTSETAVACWIAGCAVSLVFAQRNYGPYRLKDARSWIAENASPVFFTVLQVAAITLSAQLPVFIFGLTGDPYASAGYLAAAQLLSPQTALLIAMRPLVLRQHALHGTRLSNNLVLKTFVSQVVPVLAVGVIVGGGFMVLLGSRIYGVSVAEPASQIILWLAITRALGALSVTFIGILRARGSWRGSFGGEMLTSVVMGGLPVGAAVLTPHPGAIAGAQTLGALASMAIWWTLVHRVQAKGDWCRVDE